MFGYTLDFHVGRRIDSRETLLLIAFEGVEVILEDLNTNPNMI